MACIRRAVERLFRGGCDFGEGMTRVNNRQAFLLAILEDPGEASRLVFADWLQEQGEEELAHWLRQPRHRVEVAWAVIHDWIGRHHPKMLSLLNGSADEAAFEQLERQLGQTLPEDFKVSYRIHDGSDDCSGVLIGLPLMSLEKIGREWEFWAGLADDYARDEDMNGDYERAESFHQLGVADPGYTPEDLYAKIGSSYEKAYQASRSLGG